MSLTLQSSAPHLTGPESFAGPFKDWGIIPTMIEGASHTSGIVLHKGPNGESETGIWICTPGYWNCHVTRDEFCQIGFARECGEHGDGFQTGVSGEPVIDGAADGLGVMRVAAGNAPHGLAELGFRVGGIGNCHLQRR